MGLGVGDGLGVGLGLGVGVAVAQTQLASSVQDGLRQTPLVSLLDALKQVIPFEHCESSVQVPPQLSGVIEKDKRQLPALGRLLGAFGVIAPWRLIPYATIRTMITSRTKNMRAATGRYFFNFFIRTFYSEHERLKTLPPLYHDETTSG